MKSHARLAVVSLCCLSAVRVFAAAPVRGEKLQAENTELRRRVDKLEGDVEQLKKLVREQVAAMQADRKVEKKRLAEEDLRKIREMVRTAGGTGNGAANVWANLDVQLYGYVKLDAAYDTARTSTGNFARWVESEDDRNSDNQFNITARQTRLGMKITGPDVGGARTSGRVEIDFYGSGGTENKPHIMMRHAYMKLDWPEHRFSIIAGQTSDVISPLVPTTLNYSVLWWCGDIGYRRPQVRLTGSFLLSDDVELKLEGALTRAIGHDAGAFDPGDTGEDAGFPAVQGRASLTFPLFDGRKATVGVSGHFAQEEYDTDAGGAGMKAYSWSGNLDLTVPVAAWLTVKGELFTGQNLDAYLGGIGQGLDVAGRSVTELKTCGGWLAVSLGPWDRWGFNVGAGVESVYDDDFSSPSTADSPVRSFNSCIFGNAIYSVNKNASVGLEVSHWHTDYHKQDSGDSLRVQTSFIYKF